MWREDEKAEGGSTFDNHRINHSSFFNLKPPRSRTNQRERTLPVSFDDLKNPSMIVVLDRWGRNRRCKAGGSGSDMLIVGGGWRGSVSVSACSGD